MFPLVLRKASTRRCLLLVGVILYRLTLSKPAISEKISLVCEGYQYHGELAFKSGRVRWFSLDRYTGELNETALYYVNNTPGIVINRSGKCRSAQRLF